MNKFICKKVKKARFYHNFMTWFAHIFLKIEILFCTVEVLKKEMNKRKRMIKNIKRLMKGSEDEVRIQFKKAFEDIGRWQKEVEIMEKELQKQ